MCLAAEGTIFSIPELALGMPYLWQSTPLLIGSVGFQRARALITTGDRIDASEARQAGLVHRVVPSEKLISEARNLAQRLSLHPQAALEAQKRLSTRWIKRLVAESEEDLMQVVQSTNVNGRGDGRKSS